MNQCLLKGSRATCQDINGLCQIFHYIARSHYWKHKFYLIIWGYLVYCKAQFDPCSVNGGSNKTSHRNKPWLVWSLSLRTAEYFCRITTLLFLFFVILRISSFSWLISCSSWIDKIPYFPSHDIQSGHKNILICLQLSATKAKGQEKVGKGDSSANQQQCNFKSSRT